MDREQRAAVINGTKCKRESFGHKISYNIPRSFINAKFSPIFNKALKELV